MTRGGEFATQFALQRGGFRSRFPTCKARLTRRTPSMDTMRAHTQSLLWVQTKPVLAKPSPTERYRIASLLRRVHPEKCTNPKISVCQNRSPQIDHHKVFKLSSKHAGHSIPW